MLPIRDNIPSSRPAIATWSIIGLNVFVFVSQLGMSHRHLTEIAYLYGVVPARYMHPAWAHMVGFPSGGVAPFLTGMFLHGGFLHIIANMWCLWIFGDNVEDRLGSIRFMFFYLACGVCAWVVHIATNASSTVPALGASGAIAGVLAAYLVLYPTAWVVCLVPIFFFPLFIQLPAVVFIGLWILLQFLSGTASLFNPGEAGGIAWWAHVGGFVGGLMLLPWFLGRKPPPRPRGIGERRPEHSPDRYSH